MMYAKVEKGKREKRREREQGQEKMGKRDRGRVLRRGKGPYIHLAPSK